MTGCCRVCAGGHCCARYLTVNDCASIAPIASDAIRAACASEAPVSIDRGPGHRGRRPRFLIKESDFIAWLEAGSPMTAAAEVKS